MQGLLTGPSLSEVQVLGMCILDLVDQREGARERFDSVKRAMVTAHPKLLPTLFPEYSIGEGQEGGRPSVDEVPVAQKAPNPEDLDRWLAEATAGSGAQISGSDVFGDEEGWQ